MCGIVGYIGSLDSQSPAEILIQGLKRLEYRGYDSAGIALLNKDEIYTCREIGKVKGLEDKWLAAENTVNYQVGIAHTRWATHGKPTEENAHPHRDSSGKIAIVHNGIIENYQSLKKHLVNAGHEFYSETDSEVLAKLIGYHYKGDLLQAVTDALNQVHGTYGLVVACKDEPNKLIAARKGSPIVIGMSDKSSIIASDVSAIVSHTKHVIYLDDDDLAVITPGNVDILDLNHRQVSREVQELDWDTDSTQKDGYEHFMLKEIFEQPEAINNSIRGRYNLSIGNAILSGLSGVDKELASISQIIILGCGTSMHAGMVAEYAIEELAGIPVKVMQAADFRYRNPIVGPNDLVIAISQSGETADTLAAVKEAKQKGAFVIGLCNVVGSSIAREAGRGVYLHAGPEISVASTKAFTCQVSVLLLLALKLGRSRRLSLAQGVEVAQAIKSIPAINQLLLDKQFNHIATIAPAYTQAHSMFFLGRGYLYPVALEGALKLKEISYIHAEGYHAAELKHGPIALLEEGTPIVALLNDIEGKDKMLGNVEECKARGARILGIITEGDTQAAEICDDVIEIPSSHKLSTVLSTTIALQLFSYQVAKLKGCEIDQPRNLAKSVTVE